MPACTSCERAGKAKSCSGANDEYAKGKERSYVAALEAALERLHRRLAETRALQATDPSRRGSLAASYVLEPSHALSPKRIVSAGRVHRKEASDVDNLVGDFGFLSVNATSRDFHGFTATMSFARLLLAVSQLQDIPLGRVSILPARYSILPLIQTYLDNIFVLMPFFSETDLMASVAAVYADAGRHAKATDQWMVRMVLAIVAASRSQEIGDSEYCLAHDHVAAALGHAEDVLHPGSITGIQAIILLVQYSLLDPAVFSCWHLIGFASRVMVDLGLHNEPAAEVRISKDECDMRRRVFYCVYALDRSISMAFKRAFSFTDDSASVALPAVPQTTMIPSDHSQNPGSQLFLRSLEPSLYLFDLRRIQSSLYQQTHSSDRSEWSNSTASAYTNSILTDIRSWFSSVLAALPQDRINFFRLETLYSQIVALAPSCRVPNIPELSVTLIFEFAIQYADQMYSIIIDNDYRTLFTVTDVYRLDLIARQFLSVMGVSFDHLISGAVPAKPPASSSESHRQNQTSAPAPPSPDISRPTSALENSRRAMRFLTTTLEILACAQKRFGNCGTSMLISFEQDSEVLMNKLGLKQQELGTVQYITGGPPPRPLAQPLPEPSDLAPMPSDTGQQLRQPLHSTQLFMYQQQPQHPPPQLLQHASYPGTISVQPQQFQTPYQQDLISFDPQAPYLHPHPQLQEQKPQPQISGPSFRRHLGHGSQGAEPFAQFGFPPPDNDVDPGPGGVGGASTVDFGLDMPQSDLPRRSYEFLGGR